MLTISSELLEERIEYRRLDSRYLISVLPCWGFWPCKSRALLLSAQAEVTACSPKPCLRVLLMLLRKWPHFLGLPRYSRRGYTPARPFTVK